MLLITRTTKIIGGQNGVEYAMNTIKYWLRSVIYIGPVGVRRFTLYSLRVLLINPSSEASDYQLWK
jgi:hypothetical protein